MTSEEYEHFLEWCRTATFAELIKVREDENLCDAMYSGLLQHVPDLWSRHVSVVRLIGYLIGTIGNGGFEGLSADGIPADPDYGKAAAALEIVGAHSSVSAFKDGIGSLIGGAAEDISRANSKWFSDQSSLYVNLARYIRSNEAQLLAEINAELARYDPER